MWRMTPRLAATALTATLALFAPKAEAAAIQTYKYAASGGIGDFNGGPIQFHGQSDGVDGTLTTPGSFVLGTFLTSPLPATATLTYDHTPFTIDLRVASTPGGNPYDRLSYDYKISGVLNGSITGAGSSDMVAAVTSIAGFASNPAVTPPFPIEDLKVNALQGIAAPHGYRDGVSILTAQVIIPGFPAPAPEPTSVAAFAAALAGWTLRRRLSPRV